ncbi:polysaccharide deacetylase family protein [Gorillibacterium sp. sgz5001074]|uniref:polysaccharide deacetylase family protein n=1 Tax=Gorillibacterium sp. sgz5001074 TaxID=3446695 RepID=UPI003F680A15
MTKSRAVSALVYAAVLLFLLAVLPAAVRMKPHPLTPAFAMLPAQTREPGNALIVDPTRPHAEVPPGAETASSAAPLSDSSSPPASTEAAAAGPERTGEWSPSGTPPIPAASAPTIALPAVAAPEASPAGPSASVTQAVYQPGSPSRNAKFKPIPVLNYHSVSVDPGNIVVIHPDKFREQMQYLHDNGYSTLTLKEFTDIFEGAAEAPAKPVLLTFDDGYTDNYMTAMPVLKEYGFHATLFMSPGMVGTAGYIDWDQARALQENGWDIQPHGMTHPSLPKLSTDDQTREITEARRLIEEHLKVTADVYCYPYGQYNKETLDILTRHGFRYAFTIEQGKTAAGQHPYKLTRIFVNGEEKLASLIHKLTKW